MPRLFGTAIAKGIAEWVIATHTDVMDGIAAMPAADKMALGFRVAVKVAVHPVDMDVGKVVERDPAIAVDEVVERDAAKDVDKVAASYVAIDAATAVLASAHRGEYMRPIAVVMRAALALVRDTTRAAPVAAVADYLAAPAIPVARLAFPHGRLLAVAVANRDRPYLRPHAVVGRDVAEADATPVRAGFTGLAWAAAAAKAIGITPAKKIASSQHHQQSIRCPQPSLPKPPNSESFAIQLTLWN